MILFKTKVRKSLLTKTSIIFGVGSNLFVIFNLDYLARFFFFNCMYSRFLQTKNRKLINFIYCKQFLFKGEGSNICPDKRRKERWKNKRLKNPPYSYFKKAVKKCDQSCLSSVALYALIDAKFTGKQLSSYSI